MKKKNQVELKQEKEIVRMTNGSCVEISLRKNEFITGKLLNESSNITVYIPESYLEPHKESNPRKIIRTYF